MTRDQFFPEFDQEMASTRTMLAAVPDALLDYKPHEKSMTMRQLAGHVAEIPAWTTTTLTTEALQLGPDFQPTIITSSQQLLESFDEGVRCAREALLKATDEELEVAWTLTYMGQTIFSLPRVQVLRSMVLNHMVHHRAQLGVYLRLNNLAVPGMYGPSADEMNAFTQSA